MKCHLVAPNIYACLHAALKRSVASQAIKVLQVGLTCIRPGSPAKPTCTESAPASAGATTTEVEKSKGDDQVAHDLEEVVYVEEEVEEEVETDDEIVVLNHEKTPLIDIALPTVEESKEIPNELAPVPQTPDAPEPKKSDILDKPTAPEPKKPDVVESPTDREPEKPEAAPPTPPECKCEEDKGTFKAGSFFSNDNYLLLLRCTLKKSHELDARILHLDLHLQTSRQLWSSKPSLLLLLLGEEKRTKPTWCRRTI